jgi:hypothetical protein
MDAFTQGYIECALWASSAEIPPHTDQSFTDLGYTSEDLAPETLAAMIGDCVWFQAANRTDLEAYYERFPIEYAGHDFWLTRNGHGAGFWDRELGELGERLSDDARGYGAIGLYLGTDGRIHHA